MELVQTWYPYESGKNWKKIGVWAIILLAVLAGIGYWLYFSNQSEKKRRADQKDKSDSEERK